MCFYDHNAHTYTHQQVFIWNNFHLLYFTTIPWQLCIVDDNVKTESVSAHNNSHWNILYLLDVEDEGKKRSPLQHFKQFCCLTFVTK